jgi:SH3-like domain-containing protein
MVFLVSSILLFFLFSALFAHKYLGKHQIFTVAIANTELKSGPDKALTTIGKIKPGEIVQLYEISGKWGKTKSFQDNIEGWIKLDKIKKIIRKSY